MSQINKPLHYQTVSGMQPIDVIEAFDLGFNLGNSVKYILRAGKKDNRATDLAKALWYIQRELDAEAKPEATEDALPYYREGRRFRITKVENGLSGEEVGGTYTFTTRKYLEGLGDERGTVWHFEPDDYKSEGRFVWGNTVIEFEPEDV